MGRYGRSSWAPYVPVADRRRRAAQKVAKMKKAGQHVSPVEIEGRQITTTFWGDAWCKNLESYSDYANRLPRGRTYVRNGSVIHLQLDPGSVHALVNGTELYTVSIKVKALPDRRWRDIKKRCAGQIDSLVELLQGSLSKGVMEIVTQKGEGLFPAPGEISISCSCPDWATMCKHVAAALYGAGARLDDEPELLFTLRGVDPTEMVAAAIDAPTTGSSPRKGRALQGDDLSSLFGVDIDVSGSSSPPHPAQAKMPRPSKKAKTSKTAKKKTAKKKTAKKKTAKKKTAKKAKTAKTAKKKTAKKKTAKKKTAKKATKTAKKTNTAEMKGPNRKKSSPTHKTRRPADPMARR